MQVKNIVLGLIEENGWSIDSLAKRIGLTRNNLEERLENGADIELVYKLCDTFSISIDALYSLYQKQKRSGGGVSK